jgi:hypothetical protein
MKRLPTGVLLGALLAYAPYATAKQLFTGRYHPEKKQYLVGEPIIVDLEVVNHGQKAGEIGESNCISVDPGPFEVDAATRKEKPAPFDCSRAGFAGSCLVGARQIPVGGKHIRRLFLNGPFVLNSPRTYHVRASSEEDIGRWGQREDLARLHVESEFYLTLRVPREGELETAYQPFLNDLNAPDFEIRYFAVTAIAQRPPPFVEPVLTKIVDSPGTTIANIVDASIEGLGRLGTPTARAKLIAMASTDPDEFRQPAIRALGELGNPSDCRALLFIGSQNKDYTQGEAYMYAGRICKERSIPALLRLLPNADAPLSGYLAIALENTLSRDAISPLFGLLASPDEGVRRDAEESLETLTHRKSQYGIANAESSNRSRMEWTNWWAANGSNASIYGPGQCVDPQPLGR